MLELHIWGPAFGLPSIDAECLATLLYIHSVLPKNLWRVIPSNNPNLNPFQQLPALRDSSTWTAGFDDIRDYLSTKSNGDWDIDRTLDELEKADCDAYTSFLRSRGFPLIDLALYVSSDNYTTRTRAALGELLTWPQSWVLPHQLREQAKRRSDHLGLSALDVDTAQEEDNKATGLTAQIPKSLRKPRQTVSGLLGRDAQKTRFRLNAVTEDFLEPLHAKLETKDWLIAANMSSADCLAIAVISLMQAPDMPQSWLCDIMANKYPKLNQWARDHVQTTFGSHGSVSSIGEDTSAGKTLPWTVLPPFSWMETCALAVETIVGSLPVFRSGYQCHEVPSPSHQLKGGSEQRQMAYERMRSQQRRYSQIIAACIGTGSILGWMTYAGLLSISLFQTAKPLRRGFGEAGAILGL